MKFETYQATPGLDHIPPNERYVTYSATHKRLMREDVAYRKRFNQYLSSIIVAVVVSGSVWLGSSAIGFVASVVLSLIPAAAILYLAVRQQHHMNQCIASVLLSQSNLASTNDRKA
jgi:heme/copper-type cytochrome/quinol oxidase subunit 4